MLSVCTSTWEQSLALQKTLTWFTLQLKANFVAAVAEQTTLNLCIRKHSIVNYLDSSHQRQSNKKLIQYIKL